MRKCLAIWIILATSALAFLPACDAKAEGSDRPCSRAAQLTGGCDIDAENTTTGTTLTGSATDTDTSGTRSGDSAIGRGLNDSNNPKTKTNTKTGDATGGGGGRTTTTTDDVEDVSGEGAGLNPERRVPTPDTCTRKTLICLDSDDDEEEEVEITLADLERYEATSGTSRMEPNGWIVTGLPTNFYSLAKRHTIEGELLDRAALVRYTPFAWHWNYGDSTQLDSATGGASWKALDQREFTDTATSHVFEGTGGYTITLVVDFHAEYQIVGDPAWTPVDGYVSVAADPLDAVAGDATTLLVGGDCAAKPNSPGC